MPVDMSTPTATRARRRGPARRPVHAPRAQRLGGRGERGSPEPSRARRVEYRYRPAARYRPGSLPPRRTSAPWAHHPGSVGFRQDGAGWARRPGRLASAAGQQRSEGGDDRARRQPGHAVQPSTPSQRSSACACDAAGHHRAAGTRTPRGSPDRGRAGCPRRPARRPRWVRPVPPALRTSASVSASRPRPSAGNSTCLPSRAIRSSAREYPAACDDRGTDDDLHSYPMVCTAVKRQIEPEVGAVQSARAPQARNVGVDTRRGGSTPGTNDDGLATSRTQTGNDALR
jgi:hypothetical protein